LTLVNAAAHRHVHYTELAKLLHAGFPIEKAADALLKQNPPEARRRILLALKSGLAQGKSIAESLRGAVSGLEFTLLDAVEQGGRLADGCDHLASYFELLDRTRRRVLARLVYPALLLHLVFLPAALPVLVTRGPAAFLVALLGPLAVLWAVVLLLAFAGWRLNRTARTNAALDRALNAIPIAGRVRRNLALARFTKVFQISLLAGRRPSEAIEMSAVAAQSGALAQAAGAMAPKLASGIPLGELMPAAPVFPRDLADAFATAEESGTLDVEAGRWADYLQADAQAAADAFADWFPKIVYGIAVIVVAWVILRFWFDYYGKIGEMLGEP
jgi:type IV pilus assembly protein PilC